MTEYRLGFKVAGNGIGNLDATGEDVIRALYERLRENGIIMVFCGLKKSGAGCDASHRIDRGN
jgi:hypothetical protein